MSYRLRPRRNSAKGDTGTSPLTVMDVHRLVPSSFPATSSLSCHGRKRSPPSSAASNKRLRSQLLTPSPNSFTEPLLNNMQQHHYPRSTSSSANRFRSISYDAMSITSPNLQPAQTAVVTPRFVSIPTMTASSISMTSSWWTSIVEQSLTELPRSPLQLSKKSKRNNKIPPPMTAASTRTNLKVRRDELKMTAVLPEGSIGKNAQDYYLLIRKSPHQNISMKAAANTLGIKVRRVYDVTNVLEGVGLIHRLPQTETMQLYNAKETMATKRKKTSLARELDDLEAEEAQLNEWIQLLQDEMDDLDEDKSMNYLPMSDLLDLPAANGSTVIVSMKPGASLHRSNHGRSNCSFSIRAPQQSGFGSEGSLPAFVIEGGNDSKIPSIRPLLLTYPPLLTSCSSDFTEHALQDFTKHHHNYSNRNSSSSYQPSEFSQLSQFSQPSDLDDLDENDLILMNDAASTLTQMAAMCGKVGHSPLTTTGKRPSNFWTL